MSLATSQKEYIPLHSFIHGACSIQLGFLIMSEVGYEVFWAGNALVVAACSWLFLFFFIVKILPRYDAFNEVCWSGRTSMMISVAVAKNVDTIQMTLTSPFFYFHSNIEIQ